MWAASWRWWDAFESKREKNIYCANDKDNFETLCLLFCRENNIELSKVSFPFQAGIPFNWCQLVRNKTCLWSWRDKTTLTFQNWTFDSQLQFVMLVESENYGEIRFHWSHGKMCCSFPLFISVDQIDFDQPIEDQGPFDLLFHKFTDKFGLAEEGCPEAIEHLRNLEVITNNWVTLRNCSSLWKKSRNTLFSTAVRSSILGRAAVRSPAYHHRAASTMMSALVSIKRSGISSRDTHSRILKCLC